MADAERLLNHTEYKVTLNLEISGCDVGSLPSQHAEHEFIPGMTSVLIYRWIGEILASATDMLRHASDHFSASPEHLPTECETIQVLKWQTSANLQTIRALAIVLCVVISVVISGFMMFCCIKLYTKKRALEKKHTDLSTRLSVSDTPECITNDIHDQTHLNISNLDKLKPIKVAFPIIDSHESGLMEHINVTCSIRYFLQKTVSVLYAEMDRLITQPVIPDASLDLAGSVPRHHRRTSLRRARVSSPSLTTNTSDDTDSGEGRLDREQWKDVEKMDRKMMWKKQSENLDMNSNDPKVQLLRDYYNKHCLIQSDQWDAATLVVNYVLVLLEKSLSRSVGVHGIQFVEFVSGGSGKRGLKTNAPDQFDVHMCLTFTQLTEMEVMFNALCSDVPPGKVVLCVKKEQDYDVTAITKTMVISGNELKCLSYCQFLLAAHELIDNSIQTLYGKYRTLMDRLHFRIEKTHTARPIITLDTRNMIGVGLRDIKIHIIPAIHCPIAGAFGPCSLYAVPPWLSRDHKQRANNEDTYTNQHMQTIWSISCLQIQEFYSNAINRHMKLTGVISYHEICIKILKSLFGTSSKNSLIDRGELSSYQIETVVLYMLLESSPKQWTLSCLPERLSDCYHFLKKAITNYRLPDFFIHNPHLLRQVPWLDLLPVVSGGRQENLLLDMRNGMSEKVCSFMEHQLTVSGLDACIQEYSDSMWEYEFFIFS